jgi:uncharacterized coiled-coil protein SlyX
MDQNKLQQDIEDLQMRQVFQEDLIEHLNQTVAEQGQEIDLLKKQLKFVYEQLREQQEKLQQPGQGHHELPPHY